jgi:hypothetical protein
MEIMDAIAATAFATEIAATLWWFCAKIHQNSKVQHEKIFQSSRIH